MGSKSTFDIRRTLAPGSDESNPLKALKSSLDPSGPIRFSSGKSQKARQVAQKQEQQIARQQQKEDSRLASAKDEVAKRKAIAQGKGAGRSLLTATSPTGTGTLGG
jgi:hypothetical protein